MRAIILLGAFALVSCGQQSATYTLYRSSATPGPAMRIHVASFDSKDGDEYNNENCAVARELFQKQPGVKVRYWCEKGRYRP